MHKHDLKSYEINTIPKDHVMQKVLLFDVFLWSLLLGMKTVSVNSKHYDPPPPGNPVVNLQNWTNPGHLPNFLLMPSPQTSLGAFILINFTLFHHFQDLKSLEYLQIHMENIYLLIENM